jgi:hypothetical protein
MMISLHKNATTTPSIRQRMSGSDEPAAVLALRYRVSEETARKWKRRDSVQDLSATPPGDAPMGTSKQWCWPKTSNGVVMPTPGVVTSLK